MQSPPLNAQVYPAQLQNKAAGAGPPGGHAHRGSMSDASDHYNTSGVTGTRSDGGYPDLLTGQGGERLCLR